MEGSSAIAGAKYSQICSGCGVLRRKSSDLGHQHGGTYCVWPIRHFDVTGSTALKEESASHYPVETPTASVQASCYAAGGAWIIGYKAWGSLLGRRLSKQGVIVCCLDYRNFPQVSLTAAMRRGSLCAAMLETAGWVVPAQQQPAAPADSLQVSTARSASLAESSFRCCLDHPESLQVGPSKLEQASPHICPA